MALLIFVPFASIVTVVRQIRIFLSCLLSLDLLELILAGKSDLLDDEYDNNGSDYVSAGTCAFPFRFEDSVGGVYDYVGLVPGVGSGIFVPMGIQSIGDIVPFVVFMPIGVESKGGRLIQIFWRPKP